MEFFHVSWFNMIIANFISKRMVLCLKNEFDYLSYESYDHCPLMKLCMMMLIIQ